MLLKTHSVNEAINSPLRDWSLITGRGGLQNGKIAGPKLFAPPPQDRVKLFAPPLFKSGNFTRPPYNMANTSSYRVKSTPKLFVPPPSEWLKLFPPPYMQRKYFYLHSTYTIVFFNQIIVYLGLHLNIISKFYLKLVCYKISVSIVTNVICLPKATHKKHR